MRHFSFAAMLVIASTLGATAGTADGEVRTAQHFGTERVPGGVEHRPMAPGAPATSPSTTAPPPLPSDSSSAPARVPAPPVMVPPVEPPSPPAPGTKKKSKSKAYRYEIPDAQPDTMKSPGKSSFPGGDEGRPGGVERAPTPRE